MDTKNSSPEIPSSTKMLSPEATPSRTHNALDGNVNVSDVEFRVIIISILSPRYEIVKVRLSAVVSVCRGPVMSIVPASVRATAELTEATAPISDGSGNEITGLSGSVLSTPSPVTDSTVPPPVAAVPFSTSQSSAAFLIRKYFAVVDPDVRLPEEGLVTIAASPSTTAVNPEYITWYPAGMA